VETSIATRVARSGWSTFGALGFVAAILAGIFAMNNWIYDPAIDRALEATNSSRLSHEAMLDQQVGLRGFLATGDDRFLEAYRAGHEALPELIAEASQLIGSSGPIGGYFLDMRLAQEAWLRDWAPVALEAGRDPTTVSDTLLQDDKTLFDVYRQKYDALITALVDSRDDALDDQRRTLVLAILLALLVTIAAGALSASRHRRLRRELAGPLYALTKRLEAIRAGDLEPRAVTDGPAELKLIMEGLEETAATLADAQSAARSQTEKVATLARRQAEVLTFSRAVSGNLNLRYVLRGVCTHGSALAEGARTVVWLTDQAAGNLDPFADSSGPDLRPIGLTPLPVGEGSVGTSGKFGKVELDVDAVHDAESRLAVPMVVGSRVVGVVEFIGAQIATLDEGGVSILETMATHAATAIEAAHLHEQTSEMAMSDALTGLRNRRRLDIDLNEECASSARYDRPLALLMVDIDNFKAYNDEFGHQAGDIALQDATTALAAELRATDHAYRYGGEEFAVLLRETTLAEATALADRCRTGVEDRFSGTRALRQVTISIGVASVPDHGTTPASLVAAADGALYRAKRGGRNRVVTAPTPLSVVAEEPRQSRAEVEEA